MNALQIAAPVELELSALGVEPLRRRELAAVNGGGYFAAGCLVAMGIGGIFVACAIIGAMYYIYRSEW